MRRALLVVVVAVGLVGASGACGGEKPTPAAPTENTAPGSLMDADGGSAAPTK